MLRSTAPRAGLSAGICLLAASLLAAPGRAQESVPFPMDVATTDVPAGEVHLTPRSAAVADLAASRRLSVVLTGLPMPDGRVLDLELERVLLERLRLGLFVDDVPAPALLDGLELSVWMGRVAGTPGTNVGLSLSNHGVQGWIQEGGRLTHLLAFPDANGDWTRGGTRVVDEGTLLDQGVPPRELCEADSLPFNQQQPTPQLTLGKQFLSNTLYEVPVAIETDWQLYDGVFNRDLGSMTTYVTSLLAWSSYRYEEQIQTVLTYPYVGFYTTSNDPWTTQDNGGSAGNLLNEFKNAWAGNVPNGGLLGAFLSGASLGGGVAWLPGLCNTPWNFSVSGNVGAGVTFPIAQRGGNWDFYVLCHEIGHNFNAPHTHSYCPTPLDECAAQSAWGPCQSQRVCSNQGTIMSYCHTCSGGTANITTYFHPQSVADMRSWVENNCAPIYCPDPVVYCTAKVNSLGCTPTIDAVGHPTLSGPDDFHVTASNVINNKNGILFWGWQSASTPFQGGTKCVRAPTVRTPLQNSGGNPPPGDCSGTYDFHFSHGYLAARSLGAGWAVYAQYWSRDPVSPSTTGLTDAVLFVLCN